MNKQTIVLILSILLLPALSFVFLAKAQDGIPIDLITTGKGQRYTETISVIDISDFGYQPTQLPLEYQSKIVNRKSAIEQGGGSDPNNPYAVIDKTGSTFLQPGATARYAITLANYESVTHTYRLTDTLPSQLTYIPNVADGLTYDSATRTLTWQGELAPGNLDYVIEENDLTLPYLDLADFGAANLCDDFIANGEACDDVTVIFNLGVNGYTATLYGEILSQLTVSSNGLILGNDVVTNGQNQWLPDTAVPGFVLAGLWRDVNMGGVSSASNGRWHAAIIKGLVEGQDVFYAQWHDVPQANDPNLTARHAIAVILNSPASSAQVASVDSGQALAGRVFFIYDNISDPAQLVDQGYTIGIGDKLGVRGATYAYAPCCDDPQSPQGYPPPAGATLHLRPFLFGTASDYSRTFSYEAIVNGQMPETIVNTAVASSSSPNPALASVWATHYLYLRQQIYLPFTVGSGE